MSTSLLRAGVLAGAMGLAGIAHALSLSELAIQSHLGEPFVGTVRYQSPRGDDVVPLCIRVRAATPGQSSGVPDLVDPRVDVQPEAGGGVITIRTARPVDEPLVRLSLTVNCGPSASISREFMVALDPPRTDTPPLRSAYGAPERPGGSAALPASGTAAGAAGAGNAPVTGTASAGSAEPPRPRRPRPLAPAAAGGTAGALPYEPGVTPPPGKRGNRTARVAEEAKPKYRLTLSSPGKDEPNPSPLLLGSDSLASLNDPANPAATPELRAKLRAEWRARLVDDPLAENQKQQDDVVRLGGAVSELKAQIASIQREHDAARAGDARRIAQLEEDKRTLSAWLNGLALALGFVGCVAVAALLFWNYRRRSEQKAARARRLVAEPGFAVPYGQEEAAAQESDSTLDDESGHPAWHGDAAAVEAAAQTANPAAPPKPVKLVKPAMGRPVPTGPRVTTPRPTPPSAKKVEEEDAPHTKTVELPIVAKVPPVEDFYANPPRGADEDEFSLDDPPPLEVAEPAAAPTETQVYEAAAPLMMEPPAVAAPPVELPPITFELPATPATPTALSAPQAKAAEPEDHGGAIEFSLDGALPRPAAPAGEPFGNDPAPPPPPAYATTLVPTGRREPTPTITRMKALVDELAAANFADPPVPAAPPPIVVSTGVHRTIDFDLGGDGDSEMRAQLYRQEFELKLFPEIVHGQAKLKAPQSIISLARTYYQEDFDTNRAINLLEYAADRTPDPQRVRLALLEILRMEGMAREYVAVARTFRQQFPHADEWETVAAYGKLLAPEEPLFKDADVTGYDLNMPSMWLGSTLDMTRYVLAQDLHDAMHGPAGVREEA